MMIYLTLNLETWHKIFLNNFSCAKWRHLKTIFVFLGCELKNVYNLAHYRKLMNVLALVSVQMASI
jgi:hypothetical protein